MSEQYFESRNQFPTKYTTLPDIGRSPEPRYDNAVVPYGARGGYDGGGGGGGGGGGAYGDPETMERLRVLEDRLIGSEKSNRALLDEVVRLQSDFKSIARKQDESLNTERKTRIGLDNSLRASNDLIAQMASRIKRTEDRLQEEHSTVSAIVSHTKNMEKNLVNQQQDLLARKDQQQTRVQDLRTELEDVMRAKDNVERVSFALVDEVRQLKAKVEAQSVELTTLTGDLKSRTRRLEEESRQGLEAVRRQNETLGSSELSTTQLRQQVETRLGELRDVVVELRGRQEQGNQDNHRLEQTMQMRLGDMAAAIQEQSRKREEALHAFETSQRERDHTGDIEKTKLQGKIAEIAEEVSKKLLMKEIKLREELQQRYAQLEAMMREESETMHQFERDMKRDMADSVELVKKLTGSEVNAAQELIKAEKKRQNETLQKLMEAQNLLDKQQEEMKKAQDKVIAAEIHSRKRHEKVNNEKMESLQEKLSVATATLQQALGGVSMQINAVAEKLEDEILVRERTEIKGSKIKETNRALDDQKASLEMLTKTVYRLEKEIKRMQTSLKDIGSDDALDRFEIELNSNKRGLNEMENTLDEMRREMKDMAVEGSSMGARTYTDLDARVTAQANKINQLEDLFDAKLQAAAAVQAQNMREKVESISLWQEVTQQTLKEIQNQVQAASEEFYLADERQKLMKAEVKQRVAAESEARAREVEELKQESEAITRRMDGFEGKESAKAEENDLDNIQASIRKLAESISTVKSVLSAKMQSEQKLRREEDKELQDQIKEIKDLIEPLMPKPRIFVKPDTYQSGPREPVEKKAPPVNQWSMYTAYRWLVIKQRWVYLKKQRESGAKNSKPLPWVLPAKNKDNQDASKNDKDKNDKDKDDKDKNQKDNDNKDKDKGKGNDT